VVAERKDPGPIRQQSRKKRGEREESLRSGKTENYLNRKKHTAGQTVSGALLNARQDTVKIHGAAAYRGKKEDKVLSVRDVVEQLPLQQNNSRGE